MTHQFLPYGRQIITEADIEAVTSILRSTWLTQGPTVPAFEQAVAARVGARHAVAVNSATSALHLACLALDLGQGDRLWTSAITFVASANCGRYCGATVEFVDIEPHTALMDMDLLEARLQSAERQGTLPKVVVPVHLAGSSCDMARLGGLAQRYGFAILEDASHAIGGTWNGEPVGCCRHSAITVFSFHPVKIITTAEGGLATTNDPGLALRMADLRSHGIVRESERFIRPAAGPWTYEQQELGFNYRMTELHAALGLSQLERLDAIVTERNSQLQHYNRLMEGLPMKLLAIPESVGSAVHLAVVLLDGVTPDQHRQVFQGMRAAGIGVQLHYSPVHLQPYYRQLGGQIGQAPVAEAYAQSAITLPLFPGLVPSDRERVVQTLEKLIPNRG